MPIFHTEVILCFTGILLGTVAQILLWIHVIENCCGVAVTNYSTYVRPLNLAFLFSLLILTFVRLTMTELLGTFSTTLLTLHLGLWIASLIVLIPLSIIFRRKWDYLQHPLTTCLCKVLLTALAIWVIR